MYHNADCHYVFNLSVVTLDVVMLSVVMLRAVESLKEVSCLKNAFQADIKLEHSPVEIIFNYLI